MIFKGKVWKFGDNIDTDAIIPARYLTTSDPEVLAVHCMEDADPDFMKKMKKGDMILGGENFGCGHSFARIFYRNAFNMGLPIFESKDIVDAVKEGNEITVDSARGIITINGTDKFFKINPIPPFMEELIANGGLMQHIAGKRKKNEK